MPGDGNYTLLPGETLGQAFRRAGGPVGNERALPAYTVPLSIYGGPPEREAAPVQPAQPVIDLKELIADEVRRQLPATLMAYLRSHSPALKAALLDLLARDIGSIAGETTRAWRQDDGEMA